MQAQRDQVTTYSRLTMTFSQVPNFCQILQGGFRLDVQIGCTLEQLFCEQWNLDRAYVENRISTIFLDGKPVDDIEGTIVHDGATLALSAAMPGLVGATMRRAGFYSQFRGGISYRQKTDSHGLVRGSITVKLFNVLADELGVSFLQHGVRLKRGDLESFLASRPESFWTSCEAATLDGADIQPQELQHNGLLQNVESIEFRIVVPTQSAGRGNG